RFVRIRHLETLGGFLPIYLWCIPAWGDGHAARTAPTREHEKSIATERLRLPEIDVELAQLSINCYLLVRLDVGHPVRDRNDARALRELSELRQRFGVEARQQVERDDGRPFAQVEREDVAPFNRHQPLYAVLAHVGEGILDAFGIDVETARLAGVLLG